MRVKTPRESNEMMPHIATGYVTGYDSANHRIFVVLDDGQTISNSIYVVEHGPSDPFSKKQTELPRRGTRGLIVFPNRSSINGCWIGSYDPNLNNAITSNSQSPFENYFSHWNGGFSFEDQLGQFSRYFTDGTYLQLGTSTNLPTLYRNVYGGSNPQNTRTAYTTAQRNPNPQSPFNLFLHHSSGAQVEISSSGSISISGVSGETFSISLNGTTFTIDAEGNANIQLNSGAVFELNGGGDALALVSKLVSWLASHTHLGVMSGSDICGPPAQIITPTTIESTLAKTAT